MSSCPFQLILNYVHWVWGRRYFSQVLEKGSYFVWNGQISPPKPLHSSASSRVSHGMSISEDIDIGLDRTYWKAFLTGTEWRAQHHQAFPLRAFPDGRASLVPTTSGLVLFSGITLSGCPVRLQAQALAERRLTICMSTFSYTCMLPSAHMCTCWTLCHN